MCDCLGFASESLVAAVCPVGSCSQDRGMLKILDTKVAEADVIENFEFSKAYVVGVMRQGQALPHAKEHYVA